MSAVVTKPRRAPSPPETGSKRVPAARLADLVSPVLLEHGSAADIDHALAAYDAERRPAATAAIARNHAQALRIWQSDLFRDPDAYAQAIDPTAAWGVSGAGWGQDPAALAGRA